MLPEHKLTPQILNSQSLWQKVTARFKVEFSAEVYDKWLSKLELHSLLEQEIILSVSSKFLRDWIKREYFEAGKNLNKGIKEILLEENSNLKKISIISEAKIESKPEPTIATNNVVNLSKHDNIFTIGTDLNAKFTFDNFVVGKSNKLAYHAAKIVAGAEESSLLFGSTNPLFLYGGVGLGKTHLGQSIAWHIKENNKNNRVIYLSAERFMYQFVQSLRNKDVMDFKEKFRGVDVLIIDDIQFLAGKEGTQTELLHTINSLVENNKQVVLICDRSPGDLNDVDEKLKSKISGGMIVDFKCPDYETRLTILKSNLKNIPITIKDEILDLLASKINSSVRDLEGALRKLVANHMFTGEEISIANTKILLNDLFRTNHNGIDIDKIQKKVCEFYNIKLVDLKSSSRLRNFARPRQVAMYFAKNLTSKSLPDIGKEFGGKNHATVIHAVKKVESLMLEDQNFASEVKNIEDRFQS